MTEVRARTPLLLGVLLVGALWWGGYDLLSGVWTSLFGAPQGVGQGIGLSQGMNWLCVLVIFAIVLFWERQPLRTLGFRRPKLTDLIWVLVVFVGTRFLGFIFLATFAMFIWRSSRWGARPQTRRDRVSDVLWLVFGALVGLALMYLRGMLEIPESRSVAQIAMLPLLGRVLVLLTAVVTEEVFYRGYLIERLGFLTRHLWLGAVLSFVAFTVTHINDVGLVRALAVSSIGSASFTLYYLKTRNLWGSMLLHLLFNGGILLL